MQLLFSVIQWGVKLSTHKPAAKRRQVAELHALLDQYSGDPVVEGVRTWLRELKPHNTYQLGHAAYLITIRARFLDKEWRMDNPVLRTNREAP